MAIKQQKPADAYDVMTRNSAALYLDVRTESEFAQGHPKGAINIPVVFIKGPGQMEPNPDFLNVVEKVLPRNQTLLVGCLAGGRSMRACEILEDAGYTDLTNVQGGYGGQRDQSGNVVVQGWRDSNLPVSTEVAEVSYSAQRKKAGL